MDASNKNNMAPRRVIGTTSGRVIFKNISVSATPPATLRESSKSSFFAALKPSFEKTLYFAKELTAFGRDRESPSPLSKTASAVNLRSGVKSRFGSTPMIPEKPPRKMELLASMDGSILRNDLASNPDKEPRNRHGLLLSASEVQLPQADRGRKYALVQLDSKAPRGTARGKVRRDGVDVVHRAISIEDGLGMLTTQVNDLISYERYTPIIDEFNSSSTTLTSSGTASQVAPVPRQSRHRHRSNHRTSEHSGSQHQLSSDAESGVFYTARRCYSTITDLDSHAADSDLDVIEIADAYVSMRHKSADRSISREAAPKSFVDRKNRRQSVASSSIYSNPPEMGNNVSVRRVTQTTSSQTALEQGSRRYSRSFHTLPSVSPHDSGHSDGTATTTSNDTTPPNSGTPVLRRRPQDFHGGTWVEMPGHAFQTTTTFGTTPDRNGSAYTVNDGVFTPDDDTGERSFATNQLVATEPTWDTQSADYSHMAPTTTTGTSSSSSLLPSMYPQNGVNKIAVAPQPQKKSSSSQRHSRQTFDDTTHRHSTRHSHGNPVATSTPNQLALRSANRVSRVSNEVYIDGPPVSPVIDNGYRYAGAWEDRTREQLEIQKSNYAKAMIDKDLNIAKLEGRMLQLTKDMSAKECECENIKKNKDSIERAYREVKREADNYADRLACCQKSNAQLRKDSEEDRIKYERELREKTALVDQLQSADTENKLRSSLEEAAKRNSALQDEVLLKSRRLTELEAANVELQRQLEAQKSQNRRHSASNFKDVAPTNGFETLTEADTGDELWVATNFRSDNNRTPTMPRSASSNTSLSTAVYLPANFETLLRSHYRKTMGVDSLAAALSQAVADMFSGKTAEAARVLGAFTDTEGEESEAIVSEAPASNAKITIGNAERYLRKENDMLDRVEKKLLDIRGMYADAVRKGVPLKR